MAPAKRIAKPKERIFDDATILRRVPEHLYEEDGSGIPTPGAFTDSGGGMSTEWERGKTTPETCRSRTKNPDTFGVVGLNVGRVRRIEEPKQVVEHTPTKHNADHVDVFGDKDLSSQTALVDIAVERISDPRAEEKKGLFLSSKKA